MLKSGERLHISPIRMPEHGGSALMRGRDNLVRARARMKDNLLVSLTWFIRNAGTTSASETGKLVFFDSDLSSSLLNIVFGVPNSPEEVERISLYFMPRNLPAAWWLPSDVPTPAAWWLAEWGWTIEDVSIGLVLDLKNAPPFNLDAPADLIIKPCDSRERVRDMAGIISAGRTEHKPREGDLLSKAIERSADLIIKPRHGFQAWVGYCDGQPASSVILYHNSDSGDISGLVTRPEFRHRNFAATLLFHAIAEARLRRCSLVTVQAASQGVRLYTRLGFTPVNQFVLWNNQRLL